MRQLIWASVGFCLVISGCQDSKHGKARALAAETRQEIVRANPKEGEADGAEHKIELNFDSRRAGEWKGKRFSEIVPPNAIKRIVRTRELGFAVGHSSGFHFARSKAGEQEVYDAFLAHLMSSAETAEDWGLSAQEGPLA